MNTAKKIPMQHQIVKKTHEAYLPIDREVGLPWVKIPTSAAMYKHEIGAGKRR
jgi:hypothetical protein